MMMSDLYIDSPKKLEDLCAKLASSQWVVIDTEFIREKTYHSQLCLIQIGNHEQLACIDPLALNELGPLKELLCNSDIIKIFHAGGQDMEIFFRLFGILPEPVFDTQLAAALLGYGEQIGYANLVKQILNVELDKSHSRTDWSKRPLDQQQLAYALDDVRYLRDLYTTVQKQLIEYNRLTWLEDDIKKLCDPATYEIDPGQMWQRVKNVSRLKGLQLNTLKHLASWREQRAMQLNKPRKWILGDEILVTLAQQLPTKIEQLKRIRGLNNGNSETLGKTLLSLVENAKNEPRELWPKFKIPRKLNHRQEALADMIAAVIRLKAAEHEISTTLLATRDDINKLAQDKRDIPLMRGWRLGIAGETVIDLLEGRIVLSYAHGQPQLTPR